jgi:hypothetical protein
MDSDSRQQVESEESIPQNDSPEDRSERIAEFLGHIEGDIE